MTKKPNVFPNELFVQSKVSQYFQNEGFDVIKGGIRAEDINRRNISHRLLGTDILAMKDDEEWRIECKGDTEKDFGTDFDTGLGQILRRMDCEDPNYALAMPDTERCQKKADELSSLVRKKLKLQWIWVGRNGAVKFDEP